MKDKLFEPYYKRGFDHFVFKQIMHLKKPKKEIQRFYFMMIALILLTSLFFG